MSSRTSTKTDRRLLRSWLESREFLITLSLAIATACIGYYFERSPAPVLIAAFELVIGTVLWAARRISKEIEELRADLAQHSTFFRHTAELRDPRVASDISQITASLIQLVSHPQLQALVKHELTATANRFGALAAGASIPTYARFPSDLVQEIFQTHMQNLPRHFRYDTISNLRFWSQETIQNPEEFLHVNITVANEKDGRIRRVFLLDKPFANLTAEELEILDRHKSATEKHSPHLETSVLILKKAPDLARYGNFAICEDPDGPTLLLDMHYTQGDKTFERVDVVREEHEIARRRIRFSSAYEQADPIARYFEKLVLSQSVVADGHPMSVNTMLDGRDAPPP